MVTLGSSGVIPVPLCPWKAKSDVSALSSAPPSCSGVPAVAAQLHRPRLWGELPTVGQPGAVKGSGEAPFHHSIIPDLEGAASFICSQSTSGLRVLREALGSSGSPISPRQRQRHCKPSGQGCGHGLSPRAWPCSAWAPLPSQPLHGESRVRSRAAGSGTHSSLSCFTLRLLPHLGRICAFAGLSSSWGCPGPPQDLPRAQVGGQYLITPGRGRCSAGSCFPQAKVSKGNLWVQPNPRARGTQRSQGCRKVPDHIHSHIPACPGKLGAVLEISRCPGYPLHPPTPLLADFAFAPL